VSFVLSTVPCVVAVSVTCSMGSLLARQLQTDRDPARGRAEELGAPRHHDLQARSHISRSCSIKVIGGFSTLATMHWTRTRDRAAAAVSQCPHRQE